MRGLRAVATPVIGKFRVVEIRWLEFFSDPSQWWDTRAEKVNPRYPDFKHKKTQVSLWLECKFKPPWVDAALAALAPGAIQVSLFTWNRRLARHVTDGHYGTTLELFQQMQQEGIHPNMFTFIPVFNACSSLRALDMGQRFHAQCVKCGFDSHVFVGNSLVDMYSKCGRIEDAQKVFDKMSTHNMFSWNAMILGYVKCGQGQKALDVYRLMTLERMEPDPVTFVGLLNACASLAALEEGRCVHEKIILRGYESNLFVGNSLVDMYAKCGSIKDARRVFDKVPTRDVVTWTAMILGYAKIGEGQTALALSHEMLQEGLHPNPVTYVGMLKACASLGALDEGRNVHRQIIERCYESNPFVASSLVDMYVKCGSIEDAGRVFNNMPAHDVVAWSVMILGYVESGEGRKALELYQQMHLEGVDPNSMTFVAVLNACASVGALEEGRDTHRQIIQRGYESDLFVSNSLITMYSKCGSIEDALKVFHKMSIRNVVAWNSMLAGYSIYGHGKEAIEHFHRMQHEVEINGITFVSLLSACSHAGFVDEGLHVFESMRSEYNVSPTLEHYACLVDLLGRAGRLHAAEDLIKRMCFRPNTCVWISLLGTCRVHGNVEMGEFVAKEVLNLDPGSPVGYVLLSNIYVTGGKLDSKSHVGQSSPETAEVHLN